MDASAFGGGGEARRREMLDVAEGLEMRYAVLLPPEPKRGPKKDENRSRKCDDARAGVTTGDDGDTDTDEEDAANSEMEIKHSVPTGIRPHKANKTNVRLPSQTPAVSRTRAVSKTPAIPGTPAVFRTPAMSVALASSAPLHIFPDVLHSSRSGGRVRDYSGRFIPLAKSEEAYTPPAIHSSPSTAAPDTSGAPPLKRPRIDSRTKHMQTPEANPIGTSVLLQISARKAAQPQARQTTQMTLAFGFQVPLAVKDPADYALPRWLITQQELENLHEMCEIGRAHV